MKRHRLTACSLAVLLMAAPLAAACNPQTDGEQTETPAVPESPGLPEVPELPALPGEDTEEEFPGLPEEAPTDPSGTPEETPEDAPDSPDEEEDVPAVSLRAQYVRVRTDGLNVRKGAGTGYATLGQVNAGDMLHLVGKTGDWYETRYRGTAAYVSAKEAYTAVAYLDKASDEVERVIAEGLELLGVPYVYGAVRLHDGKGNFLKNFTTSAFDCSSLMQYIFYQGAGILLDVTTRTQVRQGVPVTWENIARGDLLFYTNAQRYDKTGVERIGHVALYLGENYILHTASDYAVIEQMSATRQKYFITARRVL